MRQPNMNIAFHLHTKNSDGKLTVRELVEKLYRNGIDEFAITDHDTLKGVKQLSKIETSGMKYITGIEFTARIMDDVDFIDHDFPIHILGYGIDENNAKLNEAVDKIIEFPEANKIYYQDLCVELSDSVHGLDIENITPARKYFDDIDIIREISILKRCSNVEATKIFESFDKKTRYKALSASQCIDLIHLAGGKAVIAHPYKYTRMRRRTNLTEEELYSLLHKLINFNLDGIEVFYEEHSEKEIRKLFNFAQKHNLHIYGGSDFHKEGDQLICNKWMEYLRGDYDV